MDKDSMNQDQLILGRPPCVECPNIPPDCSTCEPGYVCILTLQDCNKCAQTTCIPNQNPAGPSPSNGTTNPSSSNNTVSANTSTPFVHEHNHADRVHRDAIIGGTIGGVFFVIILTAIAYFAFKRIEKKRHQQPSVMKGRRASQLMTDVYHPPNEPVMEELIYGRPPEDDGGAGAPRRMTREEIEQDAGAFVRERRRERQLLMAAQGLPMTGAPSLDSQTKKQSLRNKVRQRTSMLLPLGQYNRYNRQKAAKQQQEQQLQQQQHINAMRMNIPAANVDMDSRVYADQFLSNIAATSAHGIMGVEHDFSRIDLGQRSESGNEDRADMPESPPKLPSLHLFDSTMSLPKFASIDRWKLDDIEDQPPMFHERSPSLTESVRQAEEELPRLAQPRSRSSFIPVGYEASEIPITPTDTDNVTNHTINSYYEGRYNNGSHHGDYVPEFREDQDQLAASGYSPASAPAYPPVRSPGHTLAEWHSRMSDDQSGNITAATPTSGDTAAAAAAAATGASSTPPLLNPGNSPVRPLLISKQSRSASGRELTFPSVFDENPSFSFRYSE